jgi:hypothetical protein
VAHEPQREPPGVEADTQEAFDKRCELVRLLVERIAVSRTEEGTPKVDITYRFGPPAIESAEEFVYGERNSEQFGGKILSLFDDLEQRGWCNPRDRERFENPAKPQDIQYIAQRLDAIYNRSDESDTATPSGRVHFRASPP